MNVMPMSACPNYPAPVFTVYRICRLRLQYRLELVLIHKYPDPYLLIVILVVPPPLWLRLLVLKNRPAWVDDLAAIG